MAIAFVTAATGALGLNVTTVTAGAFAATAGNCIVVGIACNSPQTVSSVTDTAGNTYSQLTAYTAGGWGDEEIWAAFNVAANASNTVTVTFSASTTAAICGAAQYSGVATTKAAAYDLTSGGATTKYATATSVTSPSFTPSGSGEVGIGVGFCSSSTETFSAGTGYTLRSSNPSYIGLEDKLGLATSAQTASIGTAVADILDITVVALKPPAAAPPSGTAVGPPMDAGFPVSASVSGAAATTSIAVTAPATSGPNRLIYATVEWYTRGAHPAATPMTMAGLGLTWTKIVANSVSGGAGGAEVWAAWASSATASGAVTCTFVASVAVDALLTVYARFNTANGAASIAKCFGASSTINSTTGSVIGEVSLNADTEQSGAVVSLLDIGDVAGIVPAQRSQFDASVTSPVNLISGTYIVATGSSTPLLGTGLNHPATIVTGLTGGGPFPDFTNNVIVVPSSYGDGVTDVTTQLQNIHNQARTQGKNVVYPFTTGGYKISATLLIYNSVAGGIGGLGQQPNIFTVNTATGFTNQGSIFAPQPGFVGWLYNLTMSGNYDPTSTVAATSEDCAIIWLLACNGLTMQNCILQKPRGDCITVPAPSWGQLASNNVIIRNNNFIEPYRCGIGWSGHSDKWNVFDNYISKNNAIAASSGASYVSGIDYEPEIDSVNGGASTTNIETAYNKFNMNNTAVNLSRGADGKATMLSSVPGNTNPGGNIYEHNNYGTFGNGFESEYDGGTAFYNVVLTNNVPGNNVP